MYPDNLKVSEALNVYFANAGFGPETYTANWVRLPVGPVSVYLPNIQARKIVAPLHDVDHVVSEYKTDWLGEFQISAYELGAGLGKFWFGWIINLQGIWMGLLLNPKQCFRAYVRGRRSGSLFKKYQFDQTLLNKTLGEIRRDLPVASKDPKATLSDFISFVGILATSILVHSPLFLAGGLLIYWCSR